MTEENALERLTVDGEEFVVADLPEGIQNAVATYRRWQATAAQKQDELNVYQSALRDLGAQVVNAVREVKTADEAAAAAADEGSVDETADA